jgi:lipoprotein signal peptidase
MKTQTILTWILILIILDQAIKILIYNLFGEIHFEIIPSLIEFKPTFNVQHSWVNTLLNKNLGINVGLLPHIILYLLIGILVPMYFSYFRNNIPHNKKLMDIAIIFIMAAILCALIGNIIWKKGTLDYIYLKPMFVFDLKDVYIDFGIVLFLLYALKNREQLTKVAKIRDVYMDTKNRLKKTKY